MLIGAHWGGGGGVLCCVNLGLQDVARTAPNTTVSVSVTAQQPTAVVQVLLYAVAKGFDAVAVAYPSVASAAATRWTCLQTEGTDFNGRPMQPPPVQ